MMQQRRFDYKLLTFMWRFQANECGALE